MANQLRKLYSEVDRVLSNAIASSTTDGFPPTCRKGCCSCCSEPLAATKVEAMLAIQAIPPSELEGVKERTKAWADKASKSIMVASDPLPAAWDYLKLGLVCPLLKDGQCLVYDARPFGCRGHYAVGDPAHCADPALRQHQKFMYEENLDGWFTANVIRIGHIKNVYFDHLGAFLAKELLHRKVVTAIGRDQENRI